MLGASRSAKVEFMREVLSRYLPEGERTRVKYVQKFFSANSGFLGCKFCCLISELWNMVCGLLLCNLSMGIFDLSRYVSSVVVCNWDCHVLKFVSGI